MHTSQRKLNINHISCKALFTAIRSKLSTVKASYLAASVLAIFAFILLPGVHAQTTAQLSGTVTDPSGAVIPGAKVALVNEATQDTRVVTTNSAGLYSFPALLPSTYTLQVSAKGFDPKNLTGIELHAGDQRTVTAFTLTLGTDTQVVSVDASSEMIPVDNGQREDVLTAQRY